MGVRQVLAAFLLITNACAVLSDAGNKSELSFDGNCGTTSVDKIAYGTKTLPFQYPWMALLLYRNFTELKSLCGGSLINSRYVLTAAHCFLTSRGFKLVKVRLGEHNKNTDPDCIVYHDGEKLCASVVYDVDIEEEIIHEFYDVPIKLRHDIGLIRMAEKIVFSESIRPICLPLSESVRKIEVPKYVITGWGTTENKTHSTELLMGLVSNVPIPQCQRMFNGKTSVIFADPWQMCAMGANFVDACNGDSGSPLGAVVPVNDVPKFVQFGLVSAGVNSCGEVNMPGLYTRVPAYMDWIVSKIRT